MFSRAVYIGLHSDENYFCGRIVSKPLGEAILLKPKLEILHTLEKKKKEKVKTESSALTILLLCELTYQVTSHKMKIVLVRGKTFYTLEECTIHLFAHIILK